MLSFVELSLAAIGGHSAPSPGSIAFLRILGLFFVVASWLPVLRPEVKVFWGKRGRVPVSRRSNLVIASAMTAWCLGVFGVWAALCGAIFTISIISTMWFARQDQDHYYEQTAEPRPKPATPEQTWLGLCIFDGIFLSISVFGLIRNSFWPKAGREAASIRVLSWIMVSLFSTFAALLYWKRPRGSAASRQ